MCILSLNSTVSNASMIIQTRDAKKIQGQTTHCDHVTGLRMRSKPIRVVATREPAAALLSNLVKEVKETHGKRSINKSVND